MCWLTLVGLAWLAYRPLIGLPLLAVACIASGVAYYHRDAFRKTEDQVPLPAIPLRLLLGLPATPLRPS